MQLSDGNLATKLVNKIDNVEQTLGLTPEQFATLGIPSRDVVDCKTARKISFHILKNSFKRWVEIQRFSIEKNTWEK